MRMGLQYPGNLETVNVDVIQYLVSRAARRPAGSRVKVKHRINYRAVSACRVRNHVGHGVGILVKERFNVSFESHTDFRKLILGNLPRNGLYYKNIK
jgi:hypothetical protein